MGEIVIAGAGILDVLVYPVDKSVFETGSRPVESIRVSTGGDALNEATVLSRLGEKPELITLLGEDEAADLIRKHCVKEGISLALTKSSDGIETGINLVMVQKDGSRSFFTNPKSTLRHLSLEHMPKEFPKDTKIFCLASMFVSPLLGNSEMEALFEHAKKQGLIVCADMTKCKNHETAKEMSSSLSKVDYLFANEEEAGLLSGLKEPEGMSDALLAAGAKTVIIKCGSQGCLVKQKGYSRKFPAVKGTACVDTTGAGDSFVAGFLFALLKGWDLSKCARFANACGSLAVESVGSAGSLRSLSQAVKRMDLSG